MPQLQCGSDAAMAAAAAAAVPAEASESTPAYRQCRSRTCRTSGMSTTSYWITIFAIASLFSTDAVSSNGKMISCAIRCILDDIDDR
jgi:hypothetical protein